MLDSIFSKIRDFKDSIAAVLFLATLVVAGLNHFATKQDLKRLECITDKNIDMISNKALAKNYEDIYKNSMVELKAERAQLRRLQAQHEKSDDAIASSETKVDDLIKQRDTFYKKSQEADKASQVALLALQNQVCERNEYFSHEWTRVNQNSE